MATMKDVARLARVSTSTVSHVINNSRYVSPRVKDKILSAIAELNYAPSAIARSLKVKETRTIGMLVTSSNNPFYSEVVKGVERCCYKRGYNLILCNTEGDAKRMTDNIEMLLQKRVDGLLMMCTEKHRFPESLLCCYPSTPIIMMDWSPFNGICDIIQDNSLLGAKMATEHLIARGYTKIACIAGPQDKIPAQQRLAGFRSAMNKANLTIPNDYIVFSDFEFAGGERAMQQLLALPTPPHAVFTSNDAMAVGVYKAIYQAGLKVGSDIAIIGYDNIELSQYLCPPLTTIHQAKDQLGQLAVDTLLNRLNNANSKPETLSLTPKLVERESVYRKIKQQHL